ncbi:MAG: ABC transporter permease [Clostridia bacterium]|nr:ABC transporter permease [Clostridia bacterium]
MREARARWARWAPFALLLPPLLVLALFFAAPYANMIYISFLTPATGGGAYGPPLTLGNYRDTLGDPFNWRILARTIGYAALTAFAALVLGYPLAYHLVRQTGARRAVLMVFVLAPLLVDVVIRSYGWMVLLADTGLVNSLLAQLGLPRQHLMYNGFGVVVGLVHVYLPFMVLSLLGSLGGRLPELELAARGLGADGLRTFLRVTWPLSLPGVFSGTVLVFVLAASSYVIPSLLGGNQVLTMPMLVAQRVLELFDWPSGASLAAFMSAFTLLLLWGYVKLMGRAMRGIG